MCVGKTCWGVQARHGKKRKDTNVKKAMLVKMMLVLVAVALVAGCAGTGKGPTDKELLDLRVKAFTDALLAKDVDAIMLSVSENFYHPEVGDKASAKDMMKQGLESGFVQNGKVDRSKAETKIEKDKATVYPIQASADAGSVTVGLTLKKEKLVAAQTDAMKAKGLKPLKMDWFVTEINVEGI